MSKGYGVKRHELMYNDYVLIGPSNDQDISKSTAIADAFLKIHDKKYNLYLDPILVVLILQN